VQLEVPYTCTIPLGSPLLGRNLRTPTTKTQHRTAVLPDYQLTRASLSAGRLPSMGGPSGPQADRASRWHFKLHMSRCSVRCKRAASCTWLAAAAAVAKKRLGRLLDEEWARACVGWAGILGSTPKGSVRTRAHTHVLSCHKRPYEHETRRKA
jgi:hypothetical protein